MTAPYFDLQVNGYAGVDFNRDGIAADDFRRACEALAAHGVEGVLATIITADLDAMCRRLQAIVRAREADAAVRATIAGIHIEGPFLPPLEGYIGAHPISCALPASVEAANRLLDASAGLARIVTLAPECDANFAVTRYLASRGVVVAAGHSNASLDELRGAIDAGLSMFTHLGNGCPALLPRHDNIVQRVLSLSDKLWISFIADGIHIPPFALRNYLQVTGMERAIVVTDAMAAAGMGRGRFTIGAMEVEVGDDRAARIPGTDNLAGSAATMPQMVEVLRGEVGLAADAIQALTRDNPRRLLVVTP